MIMLSWIGWDGINLNTKSVCIRDTLGQWVILIQQPSMDTGGGTRGAQVPVIDNTLDHTHPAQHNIVSCDHGYNYNSLA